MASILTNTSAMVALQTLRGINSNLEKTQSEISTGKSVGSAKDNAAVFAISKVMESDVKGFKAISDSLSLGESTVAVARTASETVTDLLTDIKGKIVAAQEQNVDRSKIQTDIVALRDQITSVVNAAQFNGLNLLSNTGTEPGSGTVNVLSSLDRASNGTVTASNISVAKQDLGTQQVTAGTTGTNVGTATATLADAATATFATFTNATAGNATGAIGGGMTFTAGVAGPSVSAVSVVASDGDTLASITTQMTAALNAQATADGVNVTFATTANAGEITITNNTGANIAVVAADASQDDGSNQDGIAGGGLAALANIDVTTDAGAASALAAIEGLTQTAIDAAAAFGSAEGRISIQNDFVSKLSDSLKAGIGTLVDADLEAASARLQALQVQQQLGVQALSIANQAPQSILSLFR